MQLLIKAPVRSLGEQERFRVKYIEREAQLIIRFAKAYRGTTASRSQVGLSEMDKRIMKYWGLR